MNDVTCKSSIGFSLDYLATQNDGCPESRSAVKYTGIEAENEKLKG
jgi:hypothetical protein